MGKRALQLGLIAFVGAFLAWIFTRDESGPTPTPSPQPKAAVERATVEFAPPLLTARAERNSTFNLPKMAAPVSPPEEEQAPPMFQVPKYWLLRGSSSKSYELRSDRAAVLSGNYSALLMAHEKEIQPNLTGSALQAVLATPYAGTRVELTASLRTDGALPRAGTLWAYVTDPARVVIGYQIVQMAGAQAAREWQRYRVVMDVPWNAEVLAYGFSLKGKGRLWADDVRLTPVDINVPLTGPGNAHQLGVIAQAVSLDGAQANPLNMDFEDVMTTRERQPEAPPDAIKGTRF